MRMHRRSGRENVSFENWNRGTVEFCFRRRLLLFDSKEVIYGFPWSSKKLDFWSDTRHGLHVSVNWLYLQVKRRLEGVSVGAC